MIIISYTENCAVVETGLAVKGWATEFGCIQGLHGSCPWLVPLGWGSQKVRHTARACLDQQGPSWGTHPWVVSVLEVCQLNANQHGAMFVIPGAPKSSKLDTDAPSAHENESQSSDFIYWPHPGQDGKPKFCPALMYKRLSFSTHYMST